MLVVGERRPPPVVHVYARYTPQTAIQRIHSAAVLTKFGGRKVCTPLGVLVVDGYVERTNTASTLAAVCVLVLHPSEKDTGTGMHMLRMTKRYISIMSKMASTTITRSSPPSPDTVMS